MNMWTVVTFLMDTMRDSLKCVVFEKRAKFLELVYVSGYNII